jgi:hypothetical protein
MGTVGTAITDERPKHDKTQRPPNREVFSLADGSNYGWKR